MNPPNFQPAVRTSAIPLIVFYSESGCGKTFSALLLARGIAGDKDVIVSDSETGRASIYADVIPGGYKTALIEPPFTPENYIAHIEAMEAAGAGCGVIDSGSHEWEGLGGILEMAGENEEKSGKSGLHNWKKPKERHAKFIQKLLRTKIPLIVCLRAKHKNRQKKDDRGKTIIVKDDYTSPLQSEEFIFEATVHLEILPDHTIHVSKGGHPELRKCFPENRTRPITVDDGKRVAQWIAGGGPRLTGAQRESTPAPKTEQQPAQPSDEAKQLKGQIWNTVKAHFNDDKDAFEQHAWDEGILSDTESLATLSVARLRQVLAAYQERIVK